MAPNDAPLNYSCMYVQSLIQYSVLKNNMIVEEYGICQNLVSERTNCFSGMIRGRNGRWFVFVFGSKIGFGSKKR
jgi:hypothetical protein